jgi:hypothetical protein
MSLTILESFDHACPQYEPCQADPRPKSQQATTSSPSKPSPQLHLEPTKCSTAAAHRLLATEETARALEPKFMWGTRDSSRLSNFVEVALIADQHLIYPVRAATAAKYPGLLIGGRDSTKDGDGWNLTIETKEGRQPVVIVQFRDCYSVNADEIQDAWIEEEGNAQEGQLGATTAADLLAENQECDYFALCDHESLVLFVQERERDRVCVTILQPEDFRKALLGFLIMSVDTNQHCQAILPMKG